MKQNAESNKMINKFSKDLLESEFKNHFSQEYSKQIGSAIDQIIGEANIDIDKVFPTLDELDHQDNEG